MKILVFFCLTVLSSIMPLHGQSPIEIAITFDDFPMGSTKLYSKKERVIAYDQQLAELNIQTAFFCIGEQLDSAEGEECLDLLSNTQIIANHSYSHLHLSKLTVEAFEDELFWTGHMMEGRSNYRKWFRFPYLDYGDRSSIGGSDRKRIAAFLALRLAGYQHGYTTINTFDWYVDSLLKKALKEGQTVHWDKLKVAYLTLLEEWIDLYHSCWSGLLSCPVVHVLLLHQNDLNAIFLKDIVAMIREKEWVIVSPEKAFQTPIPYLSKFANTKIPLFRKNSDFAKRYAQVLNKEHIEAVLRDYLVFVPTMRKGRTHLDNFNSYQDRFT